MTDSIIQAYTEKLLFESLDNPYRLTDVTEQNAHHIPDMEKHGFTNIHMYTCDEEPGHAFFTGMRGDSFEIHHQHMRDGVEMQGQKNIMDKTPSRFIATAFSLVKPELDSGKSVRIISSISHVDAYHRLATAIGRKHKYRVTKPYQQDDGNHVFSIGRNTSPLFGLPPLNKL